MRHLRHGLRSMFHGVKQQVQTTLPAAAERVRHVAGSQGASSSSSGGGQRRGDSPQAARPKPAGKGGWGF